MVPMEKLQHALAIEALTALADDDGDGVHDAGVLENAIEVSQAEVLHQLANGGYPAVIESDHLLEDLVVTLAVERLYQRRREQVPPAWSERAERARRLLGDIAGGQRTLNGQPRTSPAIHASSGEESPAHRPRNLRRI